MHHLRNRNQEIDREVSKLLDRAVGANDARMVGRYEQMIASLDDEKIVLQEKIANCGRPLKTFDETYRTAMLVLAKPYEIWASGELANRRAVLKLVFADRLTYTPEEGYRTAKTTLPFKVLGGAKCLIQNGEMVGRDGFEPSTNWLKVGQPISM